MHCNVCKLNPTPWAKYVYLSVLLSLNIGAMPAWPASARSPNSLAGDGGVSDFYRWQQQIPPQPGVMLREEDLRAEYMLSQASQGKRILYTSTDGMDDTTRITVSGAVYFPKGQPPREGWPIIAWGHGTTGVADVCAPSRLPRSDRDSAFLDRWLREGYAIVATDYQGLGTLGPHPYLLYKPEGYSMLDAVRAALSKYPRRLRNKVVSIGQSQGSGASLGAAYLAPQYAPDVNILGSVAMGLVTHAESANGAHQVPVPPLYETDNHVSAAFEMLFLTGAGVVSDPSIDLNAFVADAGKPLLRAAQTDCFRGMMAVAKRHRLNSKNIFNVSIEKIDAIVSRYAHFPDTVFKTPIFTATGLADGDAQTANQYNFISTLCHSGAIVEWHYYPGHSHGSTVNASLVDSVPFVGDLMAGKKINSTCRSLHAPGPLQDVAPGNEFR